MSCSHDHDHDHDVRLRFLVDALPLCLEDLPAELRVRFGVFLMCASTGVPIPKSIALSSNPALSKMDLHLQPEEKLAILQAADPRRKWHSLDDRRVCVLCDRTISGRQIEVWRDAAGRWSVYCPTEGCPSVPSDWFYQGSASSISRPVTHGTREISLWSD